MDNRQRVIDRARAVAASWEQWCNASPDDQVVMWGFVEGGMKRMVAALDLMDADAITASSSPSDPSHG